MAGQVRRAQIDEDVPLAATKDPCRLATTADDTRNGLAARDGVTPVAGDRVLVKAQATGSQNGIYVAAAGAWSRAGDMETTEDVDSGFMVPVSEGTANADTCWQLTTNAPITLDTTALTFQIVTRANIDPGAHGTRHDPGGADAVTTAAAVGLTADSANAEGTATSLARSDHSHDIDTATGTISTVNAGDTSAEGSAAGIARRDHQHAVATATPGAIQPDDAAAEGVSASLARADHTHSIVAAAPPQGIGGSNAEGAATSFARSDHDHTVRETGGPTNLTVGAIADGEFVQRSGTALVGTASTGGTARQESVTTETITNSDTAMADTLDFSPLDVNNVLLFLNGIQQRQGAGADYTLGGAGNQTITWLASTGTAVNMKTTDTLDAFYQS